MKATNETRAFNQEVSKNILKLVKERKMKKQDFAMAFNLSKVTGSQWLSGAIAVPPMLLLKICDFFDVELDVLLNKKKGVAKTYNYITSNGWDKAERLIYLIKLTNNLQHITTEEYNGKALSYLIWEHHIEYLLENYVAIKDCAESEEFIALLKELDSLLTGEKAEFILIPNQ